MKLAFNKYWILVSIGIIANIFIFLFLSKNLESYVLDSMMTDQEVTMSY